MTSEGRTDVTSPEARAIHLDAQMADPEGHDQISCWCCCMDCDFNAKVVWRNDEAARVESVV